MENGLTIGFNRVQLANKFQFIIIGLLTMEYVIQAVQLVAAIGAAVILGKWFLAEQKKARAQKAPWYREYVSPPGLMIILAILVIPLLVRFLQ